MRILVTNDDGIDSTGLHVLARRLSDKGEVTVVAPDSEYSGASAALGAFDKMHPEAAKVNLDGVAHAWAVNGPPGLCVMFARLGAFGAPFDLVVSGINPGANVGRSVYHSGTIGAALTARNGGIPGVAVSQAVTGFGVEGQGWDEMLAHQRWDSAAQVACAVVDAVTGYRLDDGRLAPVVVNVNVPNLAIEQIKGWQSTVVGMLPPRAMASAQLEPMLGHEGRFHVRMSWGAEVELPADTDGGAVERGYVAISVLNRLSADPVPERLGLTDAMGQLGPAFGAEATPAAG